MFQKLLKKVARSLKKQSIPYMVIGGQAVLLYGEPRLTKDIDITLGMGIDGLRRLREAIASVPLKKHRVFDLAYIEKWLGEFGESPGENYLDRLRKILKETE